MRAQATRRLVGTVTAATLAVGMSALALAVPAVGAVATITARGAASYAAYPSESTMTLTATVPAGGQPGDVLLASLGFGMTTAKSQPVVTAPAGWTLASRTNHGKAGSLAVYWHVLADGESSFAFRTNMPVGGTVFTAAFGGVDTARPIDVSKGRDVGKGTAFATPGVTSAVAGEELVASYFGYRGGGQPTTWTSPAGMTEIGDASNGSSRSGCLDIATKSTAGSVPAQTATASLRQDYGLATITALRPGTSTAPVISGVTVSSVTASTAVITWTTDHPADSRVDYGTTTGYGASKSDSAQVVNHGLTLIGLSPATTYHLRVRSTDASGQSAASADATFRTAGSGAVPLIVDTDIFSSADDIGALAIAFALQRAGEANVLAITVNTRLSRPAVATNSWRCAAAIAQYYGAGATPIGAAMPDNGTELNTVDFVGPCARQATAPIASPEPAVTVYRRALAGQADHSVVIASVGYLQNLAALLDSPPDAISPLSGYDLVAQKVRSLVVMGGGYPSRSGENNLSGNPGAAQRVASGWPAKIVWSGYEVGDAIHTGQTISRTHPATSPVRVAYEAFVGPNNWIYSYDLTAVYHAARPGDALLTESGPGTNVIDSSGGNRFTSGTGNQYYLLLGNADSLDSAIESLLDAVP